MPDDAAIINSLSYHPATADTAQLHDLVRSSVLDLALAFNSALVECREKSLALTALQEAMMWANAAVAIHGAPVATEEQRTTPQPAQGQDHVCVGCKTPLADCDRSLADAEIHQRCCTICVGTMTHDRAYDPPQG